MRVLGVDPSSRAIGLAMMEGDRLLWARSFALRGSLDQRMADASKVISDTLEEDRPEVVVQEAPGPWTRGKAGSTTHTVEVLAKVRAVIWVAALAYDLPCREMTVNRARHLVLGKGNPKKWVVADTLKLMGYELPLRKNGEVDDDAADAVVVALAFSREKQFQERIEAG